MKTLDVCRDEINDIDKQLQALFKQRMEVVEDVVAYKIENGLPIFHKERENEVLQRNVESMPAYLQQYANTFFQAMMDCSKDFQSEILHHDLSACYQGVDFESCKVGFQGVEGSFCHQATKLYFDDCTKVGYEHFEDVYVALMQDEIDYGVVPFENSNTGMIEDNYDLLMKYGCYFIDQQIVDVKHHILTLPDTLLEDIHTIYCHPQGILQTRQFLKKYPHIKTLPFSNTAAAAKYVSTQSDKGVGAIASREAAITYGLDILVDNIQDNPINKTRFIILSKDLLKQVDANYVSIVFALGNTPGSLARVLQILQRYDINLSSIKSRPIEGETFAYYFYVDFQGRIDDEKVILVMKMIEEYCTSLRIVGSYKDV